MGQDPLEKALSRLKAKGTQSNSNVNTRKIPVDRLNEGAIPCEMTHYTNNKKKK